MPAPTDLNSQIAIKKGWTWSKKRLSFVRGHDDPLSGAPSYNTNWRNPKGKPAIRPDFVGTLEGLAGLMRELNERARPSRFHWGYQDYGEDGGLHYCSPQGIGAIQQATFMSPPDRPGDCVGDAYMSVVGKEAIDARKVNGMCDKGESSVP